MHKKYFTFILYSCSFLAGAGEGQGSPSFDTDSSEEENPAGYYMNTNTVPQCISGESFHGQPFGIAPYVHAPQPVVCQVTYLLPSNLSQPNQLPFWEGVFEENRQNSPRKNFYPQGQECNFFYEEFATKKMSLTLQKGTLEEQIRWMRWLQLEKKPGFQSAALASNEVAYINYMRAKEIVAEKDPPLLNVNYQDAPYPSRFFGSRGCLEAGALKEIESNLNYCKRAYLCLKYYVENEKFNSRILNRGEYTVQNYTLLLFLLREQGAFLDAYYDLLS